MSGHNLRLNDTEINGPGNIFYLTNTPGNYLATQYASGCSDSALLADVSSSNAELAGKSLDNQVWPININTTRRGVSGMPPSNLFEKEPVKDTTTGSGGNTIRMWSFDDSPPAPGDQRWGWMGLISKPMASPQFYIQHLPCGESICVRDADETGTGDYGITTNTGDFRTPEEEGININSRRLNHHTDRLMFYVANPTSLTAMFILTIST